jgi:hemerythrin superfamily protein
MDAFALLKADHRKVEKIFKQLEKTDDAKQREKHFEELYTELSAHAHVEEKIYYPAVEDAKAVHELTLEAYEEHHVVKLLLAELKKLSKSTEEWGAKLTVLQENVEHHVKEEEKELFPKTKKILGKERSEEIGEEMEKEKEKYLKTI